MSDQAAETAPETTAPVETTGGEQTTESPDILGQINQRLDQFGQELPNLISQQFAEQQYAYEDQQPDYGQEQYQSQEDPYGGLDPNDPKQDRTDRRRRDSRYGPDAVVHRRPGC